MRKRPFIILCYVVGIASMFAAAGIYATFEENPYVAYPVVSAGMIVLFVCAGLIDHTEKKEKKERRQAEWEDMIRQNPSVFTLDFFGANAKSILNKEIDLNAEKNQKRLKKQDFMLIPYTKNADLALVIKCNQDEDTDDEELTDEQIDQCENWQMGYYFVNAYELAALSGKTFIVTKQLHSVLLSINLLYPFMQANTFIEVAEA